MLSYYNIRYNRYTYNIIYIMPDYYWLYIMICFCLFSHITHEVCILIYNITLHYDNKCMLYVNITCHSMQYVRHIYSKYI